MSRNFYSIKEKYYSEWIQKSDEKLNLTKNTLKELDIALPQFISNIFSNYLKDNFTIKGDYSFIDLSDKICNELFKNIENTILDTDVLTSRYYTFLSRYADKKDIVEKESRIDKVIRGNTIDLYQIASNLRHSLNNEDICIQKNNLAELIHNYEEFDEINE